MSSSSHPLPSLTNCAVYRLPGEVLSIVLIEVVDPETSDWLEVINRRRAIVSVCRQWRHVADGLAVLWSRIYFAPPVLPYFLRSCLRRAGPTADLIIKINPYPFEAVYENGTLRNVKPLLDPDFMAQSVELLREVFPRVRSLELSDGHHSQLFAILDLIAEFHAVRLTSLRVEASAYSRGVEPATPVGMTLKKLALGRISPFWTSNGLYRHLSELELHDLHGLRWSDLRGILHGNTTLLELRLSDVYCVGDDMEHHALLPRVVCLTLEYHLRSDESKAFLGSIFLPRLQRLDLELDGNTATLDVARDARRFLGTARDIWLDVVGFRPRELADIVSLCTSARVLNLRRCRPLPFDELSYLAGVPGFSLPALQLLKIAGDLTKEDVSVLLGEPFPSGLIVSEWSMGVEFDFKRWSLDDGQIRMEVVEDTPDGR
ncbi:hypothetical protein B0H16DRAFT_1722594 [Mycena metata]|uniref:F-box domain-containing protein n=1 Tax=Mycena metata TaxID=1033252 RepID=A0AAD7NBK2_9AGAR|nr:hypothetical protein B0H16DRAFT_1722594 [Mycena metata]